MKAIQERTVQPFKGTISWKKFKILLFFLYLTISDVSYCNVAILIYYLFRFCSNASHITSSKRLKCVSLSGSPVIAWQIISSQHQCLTWPNLPDQTRCVSECAGVAWCWNKGASANLPGHVGFLCGVCTIKKTKTKQNYETPRKCKQKQKQAQGLTTCYYKIWICCNNKTIESLICNCSFSVFLFCFWYSWHLDVKIYLTVRILLELISTVKHNAMKWSELPTWIR